MTRTLPVLLQAIALIALSPGAQAQEDDLLDLVGSGAVERDIPLVIVSDEMSYATDGSVARATGNAEAYYGTRVLAADMLEYDEGQGRLRAVGDVAVRNEDGSYLFAKQAELSADLSEGRVEEPRALIAGGGRLAAVEGQRLDDRYNVLSKAVYSPCEVCEESPTPLWRVRARKVIHDQQTRDIVYQDATFEVGGVPVGYLPYFRHPDPSVRRRTGVLPPQFGSDGTIGYTVKTPYFIELAKDRDITITPYVTTRDGLIMEGEYRALTETGGYTLWGSITNNDRADPDDEWRGAFRGEGRFALSDENAWGFDIELASDDTYLRRYNYSNVDRVTSRLYAEKQNDRLFAEANVYYFQSFRSDEPSDTIPIALPEIRLRYRPIEDPLYGIATLTASALNLQRQEGRDVTRLSSGFDWQRQFVTEMGIVITPFAGARGDAYIVDNDVDTDNQPQGRISAQAGLDVRMPFIAENSLGTHIIEPVAQFVVAPYQGGQDEFPNEDSLDLTFDETILFTGESRFAGIDRIENGPRLNVGVRYDFEADNGLGFEAAYGRVFRGKDNTAFSTASGLRNAESDHVGAIRLKLDPYFDVTHRFRAAQEDLAIERSETYARASVGPISLIGSYAYIADDPLSGFAEDREEIAGRGILRLTEYWSVYGGTRHDLQESRTVEADGGLRYEDECIYIDLSIARRANDDRDAEDGTKFGLTVRLKSLGA